MTGTLERYFKDANLKAYYQLEDLTDISGSGFTLTNNGTVIFSSGRFGLAANFGTSNTTKYLSRSATFFANGSFTVLWWAKGPTSCHWSFLSGSYEHYFNMTATNLGFHTNHSDASGDDLSIAQPAYYDKGKWNFYVAQAIVVGSDYRKEIYLNGSLLASRTVTGKTPATGTGLNISRLINETSGYNDGQIDEFMVKNAAVKPQDIKAYWNSMKHII